MKDMARRIKVVIERTEEGYIGYPLGLKGAVVGHGNTYEEALKDVQSAIQFHIETFGPEVLEETSTAEEVFIAETEVRVA